MGRILFISDLHINHENIIRFDKRPFRDKEHMFYSLIARWNNAVNPDDTVYILGDFIWDKDPHVALSIIKKLNGDKRLIKGNHDRCLHNSKVKNAFGQYVKDMDEIKVNGRNVVMCHYPIASWKHMQGIPEYSTILLYGHVHMTQEFDMYEEYLDVLHNKGIPALAYNVGAACPWMDYQPRTLEEIIERYNDYKKKKKRLERGDKTDEKKD